MCSSELENNDTGFVRQTHYNDINLVGHRPHAVGHGQKVAICAPGIDTIGMCPMLILIKSILLVYGLWLSNCCKAFFSFHLNISMEFVASNTKVFPIKSVYFGFILLSFLLLSQPFGATRTSRHDDVMKWKHFPRYWPFVRGIHRSPVIAPIMTSQ